MWPPGPSKQHEPSIPPLFDRLKIAQLVAAILKNALEVFSDDFVVSAPLATVIENTPERVRVPSTLHNRDITTMMSCGSPVVVHRELTRRKCWGGIISIVNGAVRGGQCLDRAG